MPNKSHKLKPASQKALLQLLRSCWHKFDITQRRERYRRIDQAIQLESERRRFKDGNPELDFYDDIELTLISPAVDTVQGFMVDLFLSQPSVFQTASKKRSNRTAVHGLNALYEQHSKHFKWGRHLAILFRDLPKYNVGFLECNWVIEETTSVVTDNSPGANSSQSALEVQNIAGNEIRRLDPYNTFYDETVEPSEIHSRGEFAGYVEPVTMVELVRRIRNFKIMGGVVMNETEAFKSGLLERKYEVPQVSPVLMSGKDQKRGWLAFFDEDYTNASKSSKYRDRKAGYEFTVLYARIIPSMFGINVPDANHLSIWKLVFVNHDVLIYAEQQQNAHNFLPLIGGQAREEGLAEQTKSNAELLVPLQNLATQILDARLTSLSKHVGDKVFVMRNSVAESDLTDPAKKIIEVTPRLGMADIRQIVQAMNFQDTAGATYWNEINNLRQHAQEVVRLNRPQLGQFQKGNKTLGEFREVMQNANAELRVMGLLIENSIMSVLKTITKNNIFQFQEPTTVATARGEVNIIPSDLRKAMVEFKVADGLVTTENVMDSNVLREAIQYLSSNQEAAMKYDIADIIAGLFSHLGFNIDEYERTEQPAAPAAPAPRPAAG